MPSIYLINPRAHTPTYDNSHDAWVTCPDLALLTVAAMLPPDWTVRYTEQQIDPVDFDHPAEFVGLSGKAAQLRSMVELAAKFRARGKTALIGGPLATLDPESVRPHADILVTGEMEEIAPRLFADLAAGTWKDHYDGGRPDISNSPVPRWDLYPVRRAEIGALQTTRGCPFDCEFCDVIQYLGRKQRHKDPPQILAELDALYAHGFRTVFICDDNFTVHRRFAHTMLDTIIEWNARHADDPMRFLTQGSLDLARDESLMRKCAAAGLRNIFIGIETINEASLRETRKRQNLLSPTLEAVTRVVQNGIAVRAGIIVGFDHDTPAIFSQLSEFFQASPLPHLTIGTLSAPIGTPLHARLKAAGRLVDGIWDHHLTSNIVPAQMTRKELIEGTRRLSARAYAPAAYEQRMMNFIALYGDDDTALRRKARKLNDRSIRIMTVLRRISARGPAEAGMVSNILAAANRKPHTLPPVLGYLTNYETARAYLDVVAQSKDVAA